MLERVDRSFATASAMAGSRSVQIAVQQSKSATYTATVEDLAGQLSWLTLQISVRDSQGAFDWSCGNRGLKRVSHLEEHVEAPLDDETRSLERITKWSWCNLWLRPTR